MEEVIIGRVQAGEFVTPLGDRLVVGVNETYTVIHIGDLDFFFWAESGKYDGWGKRLAEPEEVSPWPLN